MSAVGTLASPAARAAKAPAWWRRRLVPAAGVRAVRLGARNALFCERTQRLFELNPAADLIWRALSRGASPQAAADGLETICADLGEARELVRASAEAWFDAGHLMPLEVAARARGAADAVLHLRVDQLACHVALHGRGPAAALRRELEASFGQFLALADARSARIDLVAQDGAWYMLLDSALLGRFAPERVAPEVKAAITERLTRSVFGGDFLVHAALLARRGQGLLISGAPGAGKTTLTLALAAAGWGYGSDDIVRVSPGGGLVGVPFSPAVKAGAWPLLTPRLPQVEGLATHLRRDGQYVRYAPIDGFGDGAVETLRWALILDRRPGAAAALEPVEPLAMLTELLGGAFSADHRLQADALQRFADRLCRVDCRRLVYSGLDDALAAIAEMAGA